MTRTRLFLAGSAAALGMGLLAATPAQAQGATCGTYAAGAIVQPAQGDPTNVSTFNTACGVGAVASGDFGTAVGTNSQATGLYSSAFGNYARATNTDATATGVNSQAFGFGATANGFSARALSDSSTAVGAASLASAEGATAIGWYAYATGLNSTALGRYARAFGDGSVALGRLALANGTNSVAMGFQASNGGFANSVALGANTVNTAANQVHVGGRTIAGVNDGLVSATSTEAINGSQLFDAIAGFDSGLTLLGDQIDRVDDRASAGTAVAIAMGGLAFLPDKKFNLTGNVGTYRGEWAGAMNVGALVGESLAINAGVGKGFKKRGKVGARAGFTVGW